MFEGFKISNFLKKLSFFGNKTTNFFRKKMSYNQTLHFYALSKLAKFQKDRFGSFRRIAVIDFKNVISRKRVKSSAHSINFVPIDLKLYERILR